MKDETIDQLNGLVVKYGLYSIHLMTSKQVAVYGPPSERSKVIYIKYSDLANPNWQYIENTLVEYTLLHGF